jgi:hypothetical protein
MLIQPLYSDESQVRIDLKREDRDVIIFEHHRHRIIL